MWLSARVVKREDRGWRITQSISLWHELACFLGCLTSLQYTQWISGKELPRNLPTALHHRTLFWAALAIPVQLVPCCFSSASVSRLQLLLGQPLFLFPCGFQVRAWHVVLDAGFLSMCPIQPHFLHNICLATGSCPAGSHRSSFQTFSCHRTMLPHWDTKLQIKLAIFPSHSILTSRQSVLALTLLLVWLSHAS